MGITWKINKLTSQNADGGVIELEWQCEVIDDTHEDCFHTVKQSFELTPNSESSDFIKFDDLTESKVLEWVYNRIPVGEETPSTAKLRVEKFASKIVEGKVERKTKSSSDFPKNWS